MLETKIYKIALIGNPGVGKTTILHWWKYKSFNKNYLASINVDFSTVYYEDCKFVFVDFAGAKRFKVTQREYFLQCKLGLVVFDLSNKNTLDDELLIKIKSLFDENNLGEVPLILVGCKADKMVGEVGKDVNRFIQKFETIFHPEKNKKIPFIETSAKIGTNCNLVLDRISDLLVN